MDYDEAIALTGYGKFHFQLLTACGISLISVGFQNGLSSYIFPAAECELHLNSFHLSMLNISFLVGGILSCFIWGILADCKGRRPVLISSHLLNAITTIILAVLPSIQVLILCRFINGFLIGAPGSVIFTYLAEFQPPKYRSSIICYTGLFFTSSWLLLPVLAYVILPLDFNYSLLGFFVLTPWRLLMIILIIPEVIAGVWFLNLPESPKFLISKGDISKCMLILRAIYRKNTGRYWKLFPVRVLSNIGEETNRLHNDGGGALVKILCKIRVQIGSLFKPSCRFPTLLMSVIMFANMFGLFGFGLWLPELFTRFEQFEAINPNVTATVSQLASLKETNFTCTPSFGASVIKSTVILGVTSLVCNALSGFSAQFVSLRVIMIVAMTIGGVTTLSIYWLRSSLQNIIVAAFFQGSMVVANMTVGSVVVELLPTGISAMAICLAICAGRIGAMISNFIFGIFMDKRSEIAIFSVAAVVLVGAAVCWFIPKKKYEKVIDKSKEITTQL